MKEYWRVLKRHNRKRLSCVNGFYIRRISDYYLNKHALPSITLKMAPFTTENHLQRLVVIRIASECSKNATTAAHSSSPDLSTPSTTHHSAGFSSHRSSEPQPQHLYLQSHKSSHIVKDVQSPTHINHHIIQNLQESFPSAPKRMVDKRGSEYVSHITEVQAAFHDAEQRFLDACASSEDAAAIDKGLQNEINELVELINKADGAADSEENHGKPRLHAAGSDLNSSTSGASSVNPTSNTAPINNETLRTTRLSLPSVSSPVHSSTPRDLMSRLVELTNTRLQSCAVLGTKQSEVQIRSRVRDQAFVALGQLRLQSLKDQTTELRDVALAYVLEYDRRMQLNKMAKRKRDESVAGGSPRSVEGIEPVEVEGVGGSEDNEDGGVSLAAADGQEGQAEGKKKRRRKRKKAGQWRALNGEEARKGLSEGKTETSVAEAETSVVEAEESIVEATTGVAFVEKTAMDTADAFLAELGDDMADAATAADGYLADEDMDPVDEPPLPVAAIPTHAERVTGSKAPLTLPPQGLEEEQARGQAPAQEQEQELTNEKQKRRRKRLGAAEAYEKYFARGVQAREEAKMRERDLD